MTHDRWSPAFFLLLALAGASACAPAAGARRTAPHPPPQTTAAASKGAAGADAQPRPPAARKARKVIALHGDHIVDDYAWLREKDSPEVLAYLEAENAYTDAMTRSAG